MATRSSSRSSAFYRGDAGRQKAEEELARQKARAEARKEQGNMPFRFRVGVGETTQFVVVDDSPDFFRFEHNLKNPQTGKWDTFTGCVKEWDNCPVCEATGRESYYALYLTVIDFTPFETRDGTKHDFSRKLLVVKPAQQKKFQRAFNKAEREGRTLRGALFEVTRDGDKDSSIGNDIELIEFIDEDELLTYERTWKDKEKKTHREACYEVLDYEALFQEPDTEQLRAVVGGSPAPGSRAHDDRAIGRRPARGRDAEEEDGEDDDWEKADRRGRMGASRGSKEDKPEPARRGRVGRGREEQEDDPEDDPEDERPARRGRTEAKPTARTAARGRSAPPARRGREEEDADLPFDVDDPEDDADTDRRPPGTGRRVTARGRR